MPDLTPIQRMVAAAQASVAAEVQSRLPLPATPAPQHASVPSQPPVRQSARTKAPEDDSTAQARLVAAVGTDEAAHLYDERAGIIEYHGNKPRPEAERLARVYTLADYR